ncbi:phage head closure protein [Vagococcus acidifermentans]|uniref:Head-tail adaptor protein n=1 Tax=Vagococcus acidifermentans TaxID=564710 RepID=A0A430B2D1_9ENTE|nr:phage head closure protein [Vagococcus acidifermentans]RSU14411.1 hypothetical protein CBF27_00025 [Vagococcus acidifermentans]
MPLIKNINELDQRIKFQKYKSYQNEDGEIVKELVVIGECWCKIKSQLLKEYQAMVGTVLEDTVNFVIRSHQSFAIDHTMAILYKGQSYDIVRSMPDATDKEYAVIVARLKK